MSIEQVQDTSLHPVTASPAQLQSLTAKPFPVLDDSMAEPMQKAILTAGQEQDSVGGVIECAAVGVPAGWGDPMFGGMENRIAQAVFGIPAIRGIEFGTGFAAAKMRGSQHNDPYAVENDRVVTKTNHHGGILGGITTGMPVIFRAADEDSCTGGILHQKVEGITLIHAMNKGAAREVGSEEGGVCRKGGIGCMGRGEDEEEKKEGEEEWTELHSRQSFLLCT